MNTVLILRGLPASGKSTFIKNHNLDDYTISMDKIRLMFSAPQKNEDGSYIIKQSYNDRVSNLFKEIYTKRIENGSFTVVDNTNMNPKAIKFLVDIAKKNDFRIIIVDFTSISAEECIERDKMRKYRVGEAVIRHMEKHPSISFDGVEVISYDDFNMDMVS